MVDPQVAHIGTLLRREQDQFVDYPTIARLSTGLGFETSVRTLRFYVNEGILPQPQKQGKTPVFAEREIMNLLLAIHLMKTRFHQSLASISQILGQLREDPEVLADKCSLLYEEMQGRRWRRVEREWLASAFFRTLTGALTLYPRRRRFERGPRQAGEVFLTELCEDLEQLAHWRCEGANTEWKSPEDVIQEDAWTSKGESMNANNSPGSKRSDAGQAVPRVTPLSPPQGATTIATARRREELFLQRFERNLQKVDRVFQPLEKKNYTLKAASLDAEVDDPYQNVVKVLKEHGIYDRELLEQLPHDRATRYTLPPPGLFGRKKPRLVISGIVRSPVAQLANLGGVMAALGREELQRVIETELRAPGAYHVLGVLSTVGWEAEVWEHVPRGEEYGLVLVAQTASGGWRIANSLPKKLENLVSVFDPENSDEKVSRVFYWIAENQELNIPGGHVAVPEVLETLGIAREILDKALKQVQQDNSRIQLVNIDGREILKRDRY